MGRHAKGLMVAGMMMLLPMPGMAADASVIGMPANPPAQGRGGGEWKRMDTNGDTVVSRQEFLAYSERRFRQFDTDNDGNVTLEERKAHAAKMRQQRLARQAQRAFTPAPAPPAQ